MSVRAPHPVFWCALLLLAALSAPSPSSAQAPAEARRWTVLAGLGNDMGGLGARVEFYLRDRISAFAGLGYIPEIDAPNFRGVTGAVGVRGYTGGDRHRGWVEASVSQIYGSVRCEPVPDCDRDRHFGPGVTVGYQFVGSGGFTFQVGGGVGHAVGVPDDSGVGGAEALLTLGIGYTVR